MASCFGMIWKKIASILLIAIALSAVISLVVRSTNDRVTVQLLEEHTRSPLSNVLVTVDRVYAIPMLSSIEFLPSCLRRGTVSYTFAASNGIFDLPRISDQSATVLIRINCIVKGIPTEPISYSPSGFSRGFPSDFSPRILIPHTGRVLVPIPSD